MSISPYSPHVAGISTDHFYESIDVALQTYRRLSDGALSFDTGMALKMASGNNRPYSAMGKIPIMHLDEVAGVLSVIALGPEENTGDVNPKAKTVAAAKKSIIPRSREGVRTELYFPIAALDINSTEGDIEPVQFAGRLSVFAISSGETQARQVGSVGQGPTVFRDAMAGNRVSRPTVSLLLKRDEREPLNRSRPRSYVPPNYPFGIAYALQNPYADKIQVFGRATTTLLTVGEQMKALDSLLVSGLRRTHAHRRQTMVKA